MIQWGTVGEWVGGVGAIIGAGVPLVLYLIERRERIAAQAEAKTLRLHEAERARKQQARRVSYTLAPTVIQGTTVLTLVLEIHNSSDLPLRWATLYAITPDRGHQAIANPGTVPPGVSKHRVSRTDASSMETYLLFRDENDVWWRRHSDGLLDEPATVDLSAEPTSNEAN